MIEHQETRSHGLGVLTTVHEAIARTRGMTAGLFALLLGAFCALGFAPFHLSPALIIAIVGLVWMLDGARGQRRWGWKRGRSASRLRESRVRWPTNFETES